MSRCGKMRSGARQWRISSCKFRQSGERADVGDREVMRSGSRFHYVIVDSAGRAGTGPCG